MTKRGLLRFLLVTAAGATLASGAGCGGGTTPEGDAGTDTGVTPGDGGIDTGVDGGGADTGTDSSAPDTGVDANVDAGVDAFVPPMARTTPTNGSAIVISSDDRTIVACNRQAGSVSIFDVDPTTMPPTVTRRAELATPGDEPWAAVLSGDDTQAFVILRHAQEVIRIDDLRGTPAIHFVRGQTGSEPTGIAISPTGAVVWVANWAEGTVSVINTRTMVTAFTVDLNESLVDLGSLGTVTPRPALAHPRAIVLTNDGDTDDTDETAYVTEYYGQNRTDTLPTGDAQFDVARQGVVYRIDGTATPQPAITIAPVDATGFMDSAGNATGCFPNQLLAAAINSGRLYVTAVCASPRGPTGPILDPATGALMNGANFKTEIHTGIFVVDTATNAELPAQRILLTQAFQARYDAMSVTDDGANRRIPLIANDLAFLDGTSVAYLPGYGSDAVFRVQYDTDGSLIEVGSALAHFINLAPSAAVTGRLPYGIAIGHVATNFAFTINEHSRNVSVLALGTQTAVATVESTAPPTAGSPEASVLDGRRFFVTGTGRWSFRGQAWNSCESCHGDGLTDTVTWYFARGPRQSTSLDGSFDSTDPTQQRLFNWSAIFDETHDFELNTRGNSGGVGAVVHATSMPPAPGDRIHFDGTLPVPPGAMVTPSPQAGLNGSVDTGLMPDGTVTPHSVLDDWDDVENYLRSIRSPRGPTALSGLDAADVTAGAALFAAHNCASCHGTSMWTISRRFWTPGDATNNPVTGTLRTTSYTATGFPMGLNPPSDGAGRMATLRFPAGATAGANDQIQCILRFVGTFPASGTTPVLVAGSGVALSEVRADMTTRAQGQSGFNPPSLLNAVASAPYFHGGNARTLEEAFDTVFASHHTAYDVNFLETDSSTARADHVRQLVAYLLTIDEDATVVTEPSLGFDTRLCPATLP